MIRKGKETYTMYDAISKQIELGVWDDTTCMAQRNMTLDFYYRLYSLVREHFPDKPSGYQRKLMHLRVHNQLIISQMGGGIGQSQKRQLRKQWRKWKRPAATNYPSL